MDIEDKDHRNQGAATMESPRKRRKLSDSPSAEMSRPEAQGSAESLTQKSQLLESNDARAADAGVSTASQVDLVEKSIAPFLAKHIRDQKAPINEYEPTAQPHAQHMHYNSRYCYRHRPDLKCRRQADEVTMDQMQQELQTLSQNDQQSIAHFWSLFSAAPSKHRNLMLQGVLAQCCFPQLSFLSASVRELIRMDFLSALPPELSYKILSYLDTTSLCKAAQVSRTWRSLADDDVVWHRMCEQHIDRKCQKCGWGLPALEQKRLRDSKQEMQLRASQRNAMLEDGHPNSENKLGNTRDGEHHAEAPKIKSRPWKEIYRDRFKVGINWKHGRHSMKIFKGHSNGVMCLQFDDNILATGSYDTTIKIWNTDTGEEIRTLRGHTCGVRCLQFDDTKLISGSLDRTIKVWNWRTGECISTYTGHQGGVICLHFDSTLLASGSIDNTVKIWNFEDKSTRVLRGHTDWVNAVKVDTPSRTVFTASDDLTMRLWDLDTGSCIQSYGGHVGQVQQILPLPREFEFEEHDAECVDETQSVHSVEGLEDDDDNDDNDNDTLQPLNQHDNHAPQQQTQQQTAADSPSYTLSPSPLYESLFNNDETERPAPPRYMLTASLDSTLRLWEVPTGRCLRTFFGHIEGVWALGADTLRVVSGAQDRMTKVWDPRTGKCERTFTGHLGPITCIGLSDSQLATGSEDGEVRMCNFRDGN